MNRKEFLQKAIQTVCHDRNNQYGEPEQSFDTISEFWTTYLQGVGVIPKDKVITKSMASDMMVLLKIARNISNPKEDNYIDACGYAAIAGELQFPDDKVKDKKETLKDLVNKTDLTHFQ